MSCTICDHAAEHGSWPVSHRGTHCRDCHRSWSSLVESHCTICCQHFSVDSIGDLHAPYCTSDPTECAESMREAVRKDGKPLFDVRVRKEGKVWIRFDPRPHPHREKVTT